MSELASESSTRRANLLHGLAGVEDRVRRAVEARRRHDPQPDDPFRGLYVSDDGALRLLDRNEPPHAGGALGPDRLAALAGRAGLSVLDVDLLLLALAPGLDSRFEQLYGYLNDDVTRRRASVATALRLCGVAEADPAGRRRLSGDAPLLAAGLVVVDDGDRPFLSRALHVPDRVVAHLLGDDRDDPALATVLAPPPARTPVAATAELAAALARGVRLCYLRDRPGGSGSALAASALAAGGRAVLAVDADALATHPDAGDLVRSLRREALLRDAGLVVEPVESLVEKAPRILRVLAASSAPVLFAGAASWDPHWAEQPPLQLDAAPLTAAERAATWCDALGDRLLDDTDPAAATAQFLLGPTQIVRAARAAALHADVDGGPIGGAHLRRGAREQNAAGLERLARRIRPSVGWADLVLPPATTAQLRGLAARARNRVRVLDEWAMRPGGGRGRGIAGLFAGESGTGKTMSAEVVAADLGLDLYTVDLATVVDKYVGETEKNLERIFTEASRVNGVLLFDEADAIFGKRSEVRDSHDRYANIESAYLLQRMESFDGIALLATNLRANLDEAFTRRLDVVVDFPSPDEAARRALWDRCLGTALPRADDVDLDFCAAAFELSGGNIRAVAITAAYLAADAGRPVSMADLVAAVATEYRKLGRLLLDREFGPYLAAAS